MTETRKSQPEAPKETTPTTEQAGLEALAADLKARREKALAMGGP
jgi:hypothetical protein